MLLMVMTLDVSKLSGWLNADAPCRESEEGHMMRGECGAGPEAGGGGRPGRTQRAGEGSTTDMGQATRGAHVEHEVHGRDARRVEAQRLVERRRTLPRVKKEGI